MSQLIRPVLITAFTISLLGATAVRGAEQLPKIIFDTDMGGDCDDVGALFILHGAVERGEAKILATMGCVSADAIAPCLDAINTWFGHPEIPVGTLKDPGFLAGPSFTGEIAKRFPHQFPHGRDYPDAVTLYRQVLAKQPDHSVVIVAVGPLRNLANLLKSGADDASPLKGRDLVAKKVKGLEVMGGKYPPSADKEEGEWNFVQDPASAASVCDSWPTPVLFNGEGGSTNSGRRVTYEMAEHNPLTMAYRAYPGVGFAGDRLSWDSISGLVAVRGASPWFTVVDGGVNEVDPRTGVNHWRTDEKGKHQYLVLKSSKTELESALEDLMTVGKGRPTRLTFDTAYYAPYTCTITGKNSVDANTSPINAFDRDDETSWIDKVGESWIQCQYTDGRKYLVTSYTIVCPEQQRLPRTLELLGSQDGGKSWQRLDLQVAPGFSEQVSRREFTLEKPGKWNTYRLNVTAASPDKVVQIATIELNEAIECRVKPVTGVSLDQAAVQIVANGRASLNATITPWDSFEREVRWSSSDPTVAEVRRIGEQIAVVVGKKPGKCTMTATIDQIKQTCPVTVTPSPLPPDWAFAELNTPAIPGSVAVAEGTFTLAGCGHGMTSWWERIRDQGVFVSQPAPGDGEISARLTSLGPDVGGPAYSGDTTSPTAAGLMIRESLAEPCGRYVLIQVEARGSLVCRWRDKSGDQDDNQSQVLGTVTLPVSLKLTQKDRQIQVFTSSDGQNWGEPRLSRPASFDKKSRIGLFVCSGNTFASATATFSSVKVGR